METGERIRILRPVMSLLNLMKDTGNDFKLKVTYNYYSAEIEEPEDNGDNENTPPTGSDDDYKGACGEFYKSLCYGRAMI